jgi:isocitrate/isopropylmalate dehydrogenase
MANERKYVLTIYKVNVVSNISTIYRYQILEKAKSYVHIKVDEAIL